MKTWTVLHNQTNTFQNFGFYEANARICHNLSTRQKAKNEAKLETIRANQDYLFVTFVAWLINFSP